VAECRPIYHFTHLGNLARIVDDGEVRCHMAAAAVVHIADPSIKRRRATIRVPCGPGGVVGDYVPFYFAPRSPMLFRIHRGGVEGYEDGQRPLVYLCSTTERILIAGLRCVFSDGNAATRITRFYDDPDLLGRVVDWPLMQARYWSNTEEDGDRVRRRQAEFLVHRSVPLELIDSLAVIDDAVRSRVEALLPRERRTLLVHVRPDWYF
jgi:hypothetical protein